MGAKGAVEWEGSQVVKLRMKEFTKLIRGGGREFQAGEIVVTYREKKHVILAEFRRALG